MIDHRYHMKGYASYFLSQQYQSLSLINESI